MTCSRIPIFVRRRFPAPLALLILPNRKRERDKLTETARKQVARVYACPGHNSRISSRSNNTRSTKDTRYRRWRSFGNVFSSRCRARNRQRWVEDLEEQPSETLHCENRPDAPEMILRIAEDRRLSSCCHVVLRLIGRHGVSTLPLRSCGDKEENYQGESRFKCPSWTV